MSRGPLRLSHRLGDPTPVAAPVARGNVDIVEAASSGHVGAVRHLLRTVPGAAAAKGGFFDRTALHVAALGGHTEICRVLLGAGAAVDARDNSGPST